MNRDLTPIGDEPASNELLRDLRSLAASPWHWATAGILLGAAASILAYVSWRAYIFAPFADAVDWAADALETERTGEWTK